MTKEEFNLEDFNLITDEGNWAESVRQEEITGNMAEGRLETGLTEEDRKVIKRLELFAKRNNLVLFNVKGSLYDRVRTITSNNGACPCKPKERSHCPCKESIEECKEKGECFCRLFLSSD